ncbi:MAG: restriction endonuclease, SacI family [Bacteroides sp.]
MKRIEAEYAQKVLLRAKKRCKKVNDTTGKLIEKVLYGSHKTYKYILVNALLAKSTNEEIDALSLQASDDSEGAYDARSLCHKVIVPFEREYYPNGIGGSNEPFLNKPARFKRLSENNAVRRGNDRETLRMLIVILSSIRSSKSACLYLSSAIYDIAQISQKEAEKYTLPNLNFSQEELPQTILDYIITLTKQSIEGEICPLVVSALEHLYYEGINKVVPHKVNESGLSSKEVGDIDVFTSSDELLSSIEVKDKDFTKEDVEHAIHKFVLSKVEKSLFIFGRKVNFDKDNVFETAAELGKQGFYCTVISIEDYAKMRIYSIKRNFSINEFVNLMLHFAREINAKDETVKWIKDCATEFTL